MFRCPHCGKKAFLLIVKLGINTGCAPSPRCPYCDKTAYRYFVIGGPVPHSVISALITVGFVASLTWSAFWNAASSLGFWCMLFPLLLIALYASFNYYFSYFETLKKNRTKTIMIVGLKNSNKVWPHIRKGEIYELLSAKIEGQHCEEMYTIAKVEKIKKGEVKFRIIRYPLEEGCAINDELVILCKDRVYSAFVKDTLFRE